MVKIKKTIFYNIRQPNIHDFFHYVDETSVRKRRKAI